MGRLLSRVKQIEACLTSKKSPEALLCREPGPTAGYNELVTFNAQVIEARKAGRVVVIHSSGAGHIKPLPGLVVVESAFDAWLAQAANSPSKVGPGNRLSEIIQEIQGTSLPVRATGVATEMEGTV